MPDSVAVVAHETDQRPAVASYVDARPRARRMVGPLATLGGAVVALGYLAAVDPSEPGHYPLCPTQFFLGVDCPGCGMLRGTHALLQGDLPRALDHNVLLVVLVPLAVVLWLRWAGRAWRGVTPAVSARAWRVRTVVTVVAFGALLVFGVIRNLVPYLGSGIG